MTPSPQASETPEVTKEIAPEVTKSVSQLPKPIVVDAADVQKAMDYVFVVEPIIQQVKRDNKLRGMMENLLSIDPEQLETMSLKQLDKYLMVMPKILIWLQECVAVAQNALDAAENEFDDTIGTKAALLTKADFDVSQISEKMRIAKIRDRFPIEYETRVKRVRTKQAILNKLENQLKNFERMNDNIKKIRESYVVRLTKANTIEGEPTGE